MSRKLWLWYWSAVLLSCNQGLALADQLVCVTRTAACNVNEQAVGGAVCSCTQGMGLGSTAQGNVVVVTKWPIELDESSTAQINGWRRSESLNSIFQKDQVSPSMGPEVAVQSEGCPTIWSVPPPSVAEMFLDKNGTSVVTGLSQQKITEIYAVALKNSLQHYEPVMNIKPPGGSDPECD